MGRDVGANHRAAADRHEAAAKSHERAARFWHEQGYPDRSQLLREMAEFERRGATLERRWAELVEEGPHERTRTPERAIDQIRRGVKKLSVVLTQMADALDTTARLAEEHAIRREQAGRTDDAAVERAAAKRAREAAQRARSQAEQWLVEKDGWQET